MKLLGPMLTGLCVFLVVAHRTGHLQRLSLGARRRRRLPMTTWLAQAGSEATPVEFVTVTAACAGAVLTLCWAVSGSVLVGLVPATVGAFAPRAWYGHRRRVRLAAVTAAWPDGILHILTAIRTGGSIHGAMVDLASNGPEALRSAFAHYEAWATVGSPAAALATVREQLCDPVTDKAVAVLIEATRRGTDVALRILDQFVDEIRTDGRITSQIKADQRQPLITGAAAFALPWLAVLLGCASSAQFRDFYASSAATTIVAIAGAVSVAMIFAIRALAKEPPEARVIGGTRP